MVSVLLLRAAPLSTTVSWLEAALDPVMFTDEAERVHVVFVGHPETVRLTKPVKPPDGLTLIV